MVDVERRGRLVGDQQLRLAGERHGDHHALAHAARECMGKLAQTPARIGNAHQVEQPQRLGAGLGLIEAAMADQHFRDLRAHGEDRVEARHRLLEDHADAPAAHVAHALFRQGRQALSLEQDVPLDTPGILRHQPHDREGGGPLLPEPLSPTTATVSRSAMSKLTSFTTGDPLPVHAEGGW